jgi:hypothetical protein
VPELVGAVSKVEVVPAAVFATPKHDVPERDPRAFGLDDEATVFDLDVHNPLSRRLCREHRDAERGLRRLPHE